jgi:hypothetical protein
VICATGNYASETLSFFHLLFFHLLGFCFLSLTHALQRSLQLVIAVVCSFQRLYLSAGNKKREHSNVKSKLAFSNLHNISLSLQPQVLPALLAPLQQQLQVFLSKYPDILQALHNLTSRASKRARLFA